MGKSSPKTPATQTVTNVTKLPDYIEQAGKEMWDQTKSTSQNLQAPYSGQMVANETPDHQSFYSAVRNAGQSTAPTYQNSIGTLQDVQNYTGSPISAQSYLNERGNVSDYMSPYTREVTNQVMKGIEDQRLQGLNTVNDLAQKSGAAWGSRHAIAEAANNIGFGKIAAQSLAELNQGAFNNAQSMLMKDMDRRLSADQSNQTNSLQAMQARTLAATGAGNMATQLQNAELQKSAALEGIADKQRDYQQELLNEQMAKYDLNRNFDLTKLGILQSGIGVIPYGQTSTSTGPSGIQPQNKAMTAIGGALSGAKLGSMLLPGVGTALGVIGGGLAGLSDEDEKTNKKLLGKDPITGIPIYAYDCKSDVEAAKKSGKPLGPKRVGPMARDLDPSLVTEVGGKKVIKNLGMPMKAKKKK